MKNEPKIEVGYPVFLLKKDDRSILPGIVCGQVTNKILTNGNIREEVSLKIMIGPPKTRKVITSDKLPEENFEIFGNLHELKDKIFEDLLQTIGKNVNIATSNLKAWYQEEISMAILTSALQPKKIEEEYVDAPNKTFKELAGEEAAKKVAAKPLKKKVTKAPKKKAVTVKKKKSDGYFEPVTHEEEELVALPITSETKIRIKIPDGNGGYTFLTPEEMEKSNIDAFQLVADSNKDSQ